MQIYSDWEALIYDHVRKIWAGDGNDFVVADLLLSPINTCENSVDLDQGRLL
jgi:hypothetical protein